MQQMKRSTQQPKIGYLKNFPECISGTVSCVQSLKPSHPEERTNSVSLSLLKAQQRESCTPTNHWESFFSCPVGTTLPAWCVLISPGPISAFILGSAFHNCFPNVIGWDRDTKHLEEEQASPAAITMYNLIQDCVPTLCRPSATPPSVSALFKLMVTLK